MCGGMYVELNELTARDSYFIDPINQKIRNYLTPNNQC